MGSTVSSSMIKVSLKDKGIKDIDVDVKNAHMLPSFSKLQELNVSQNKISEIPSSILSDLSKAPAVIESLTILNFNRNRLVEIPEAFYKLYNLKVLKLEHNVITVVPPKINSFYALEELHLSNNSLKRLPWNIHHLTFLKLLFVESNQLEYLPNNLGRMRSINQFAFKANPIVDHTLAKMENLDDIFRRIQKQKVPNMYKEEARLAYQKEQSKYDALSVDAQTVRTLLKFDEGLEALQAHTRKELSAENLEFYLAIRHFKRVYNSQVEITSQRLIADAKKIYDRFIAPDAKEQVNIPGESIDKIKKAFTDTFSFPKGINQWVFNTAYKASFDLLVTDSFMRFKLSAPGKEILAQLERHKERRRKYTE